MDQINLFDVIYPRYQIKKPVRLIECFAGIGSQAKALERLGADFEHYKVVEFDKYAIKSYNAIHGTNFETSDIREVCAKDLNIVDTDAFTYILTYSFPCQDLSLAGKRKGMSKGSNTRSGLLWEVERILDECVAYNGNLPEILLMENVPQVIGQKNIDDFKKWQFKLETLGYTNYVQLLNAKDYGTAQDRNRCFMVSFLGGYNYKFPEPMQLEKKLKDYLEDEVDGKYYINNEKAQKLIQNLIEDGTLKDGVLYMDNADFEMDENYNQRGKVHGEGSICRTILARGSGNEPKVMVDLSIKKAGIKIISNCITAKDYVISDVRDDGKRGGQVEERRIGNIYGFDGGNYAGNVYDSEGICPTIRTFCGGNQQPMIVAMRGRNPDNPTDRTAGIETEQRLEPNSQGICNTLTSVQKDNLVLEGRYRIRKLTPLECWRLMGFDDEDFHKAKSVGISDTQLYKQAGNSIVVDMLYYIFRELLGF